MTCERCEGYQDALQRIETWADAYPVKVFPEPDLPKARQLLEAGGITLDSVSAYCMRHAIKGVGKIAKDALQMEEVIALENEIRERIISIRKAVAETPKKRIDLTYVFEGESLLSGKATFTPGTRLDRLRKIAEKLRGQKI